MGVADRVRVCAWTDDVLVGADDDVYLPLFKACEDILDILCRAGAGEEVDGDGEVFQALLEGAVMLHGQDRGGHEQGCLLAVGGGLEGGSDGGLLFSGWR